MSKQVLDMDFKQVIIVRRDINMGTGKIAAQVAHAAVMGAEKVKASRRNWFSSWFAAGQAKVVLKVKNIEELMEVRKQAERSEEHTSELQSPCNLVCRLLHEKKKKKNRYSATRVD